MDHRLLGAIQAHRVIPNHQEFLVYLMIPGKTQDHPTRGDHQSRPIHLARLDHGDLLVHPGHQDILDHLGHGVPQDQ